MVVGNEGRESSNDPDTCIVYALIPYQPPSPFSCNEAPHLEGVLVGCESEGFALIPEQFPEGACWLWLPVFEWLRGAEEAPNG